MKLYYYNFKFTNKESLTIFLRVTNKPVNFKKNIKFFTQLMNLKK